MKIALFLISFLALSKAQPLRKEDESSILNRLNQLEASNKLLLEQQEATNRELKATNKLLLEQQEATNRELKQQEATNRKLEAALLEQQEESHHRFLSTQSSIRSEIERENAQNRPPQALLEAARARLLEEGGEGEVDEEGQHGRRLQRAPGLRLARGDWCEMYTMTAVDTTIERWDRARYFGAHYTDCSNCPNERRTQGINANHHRFFTDTNFRGRHTFYTTFWVTCA